MSTKQPEWCGPFALSIITGKSYDSCIQILKSISIGDQNIEGLWIGSLIVALKSQGFKLRMMKADGAFTLTSFRHLKGLFLCEIKGHYVVLKNGVLYDNAHPNGSDPSKHRVLRAYEVLKNERD